MPYLKSLNPLFLKNIAYIGSLKHLVFVSVSVSLSFYMSLLVDDKLSEHIWFVIQIAWSRISYSGDKWTCCPCGTIEQGR